MDRNTIIGFLLIGIVLMVFTWLNQPTPEQLEAQRRYQDSIAAVEFARQMEEGLANVPGGNNNSNNRELLNMPDSLRNERYGVFSGVMTGTNEKVVLANDLVEVELSTLGGRVSYVRLKEFNTFDSQPLVLFDERESKFDFSLISSQNQRINTSELYFTPIKGSTPNSLTMRLDLAEGSYLDFVYTLDPNDYMLHYTIQGQGLNGVLSPSTTSLDLFWEQTIRKQEKSRKFEEMHSGLYYKFVADKVDHLSETKDQSKELSNRVKWIAYKDKFFSSVLISKDGFESSNVDSRIITTREDRLKSLKSTTVIPFDLQGRTPTELQFYFGPNKFNLLKSYDKGRPSAEQWDLEKLVPLGASIFRLINRYFIIPIFDFLGKYISSYGLIIFLLTLIVKMILFPLTYKSYMSSAKMRVLRPQVEALNEKYPGQENAMERQKATMELYSRAGASPLSGCLPMLLQMPILIAMYQFFPSAIELRNQSFLWASDLSTYDAIVSWNVYIPIISPYFGNHISLFCLLMVITNLVYTKYNMELTNTGQQQMPGMKIMMYMMPLMLFVFFNQNAAGLSYYYFISTLITIIQTLLFRYTINEEKLLAKLEANKKKPQKKSGFMKRLEEAQKLQQEQLKQQQEQRKNNQRKK